MQTQRDTRLSTPGWWNDVAYSGAHTRWSLVRFCPAEHSTPVYRPVSLSVAIFCALAMLCILGLFIRRKLFGGELGGSKCSARISAVFFVSLWVIFYLYSIIDKQYDVLIHVIFIMIIQLMLIANIQLLLVSRMK